MKKLNLRRTRIRARTNSTEYQLVLHGRRIRITLFIYLTEKQPPLYPVTPMIDNGIAVIGKT